MPEPEAAAITSSITSSLVLAADDPAALVQFYGALLGVEPQPGLSSTHWRVPWPTGGWLEVYAPSRSRPQPQQPGRLTLCLQRKGDGSGAHAVLNDWTTAALALGASLEEGQSPVAVGAALRVGRGLPAFPADIHGQAIHAGRGGCAGRDGPVPRRRRGWHLRAAG